MTRQELRESLALALLLALITALWGVADLVFGKGGW